MKIRSAAIIDDDDKVLDLIELILKEEGVEIIKRSHSAEDILGLIGVEEFDFIISDLILPGMTGLELLDAIHEMGHDIPFVLITGYASLDSAIEAVNKGAFYYIKKPFNIEEIRFVLSKVSENKEMMSEVYRLKQENKLLKERLEARDADMHVEPRQMNQFLAIRQDADRIFATIEYLGRLKEQGLITESEFGEYKGRLLKRII